MPAIQAPVLDKKPFGASGGQMFTAADLASGFMADVGAQNSTQYALSFRLDGSGTAYIGASGHGGGGGDYDELIEVTTADLAWPAYVRREDLAGLYCYAATSKDVAIRVMKVVG
mgnify:CR=1 FL=1